jgi:phage terminase large subunit-like protein
MDTRSFARLAEFSPEDRAAVIKHLSPEEQARAGYFWPFWARPDQIEPAGDWRVWLLRSGRGAGKTRTGAETVRSWVEEARYGRLAFVGATAADVRDIMVDGESGILATAPPWFRPNYEPGRRRLTWPNGAIATMFTAEEPDRLRGPQHDAAWCDEAASWRYPEAFSMLEFGLRLGQDPRAIVTTTPRPTRLIRELVDKPTTVQTRSATYANRANLAPGFFDDILAAYEGTRLGRQEIYGEILDDVPGALWSHAQLDALRVGRNGQEFSRVVVGVDPAATSGEKADETGIVVVGLGEDGHGYVLADASGHYSPERWGQEVIAAFNAFQADMVVAEVNQGGDMVKYVLRTLNASLPIKMEHASRGKYVRAEPVAAIYSQRRAHHVGSFPRLEDQMAGFVPDLDRKTEGSPDRVDALVWAFTNLMVRPVPRRAASMVMTG